MTVPSHSNPDPSRVLAEMKGRKAEMFAATWLRCKGWRILSTRYRSRGGEVDLVMSRGSILAFVEVKARKAFEAAAEAITPRQRARIETAARWYLAENPLYARNDIRFDAVLVAGFRLRHISDAWRPDGF